ncbi:MAG TPA: histidine phosphatase family protein [Gemmatimonadales bacterium]|nr:histidine phosphatase family protein [Gemmatimonadales bacterium]
MSRIILARHGRPVLDLRTRIPGHGLAGWLDIEREAPLDATSRPGVDLERLARSARHLIVSPLRRSRDSALLLAPASALVIQDPIREAALPSAFRSSWRLPPMLWAGVARAGWFCGWSPGVESFGHARDRAQRAARMLQARAEQEEGEGEGDVIVIGHGLMNALIAAQLRALGWHGPPFPSRSHWGFGTYSRARQLTQLAE